MKHSLDFDRLAENEVYEIVKAFDQEFFKLEDILQEAANLLTDLSGCTVVALDVEPSRQRLTAFDIVVLGQHTALAVFTLDESRTVTSQFLIPRNFLQEDLLKSEEHHSGTFPRIHRSRYSLQDSDGDSADYPALLYNDGQCYGSL